MRRGLTVLVILMGLGLAVFCAGLLAFAYTVNRQVPSAGGKADGIVVLTGGEYRIAEAMKLLAEGRARRLLISGVNRKTTREGLRRLTGRGEGLFECCVDIGYAAHDTIGNAEESRVWAERWGFKHLIIVTASYHMPRSLAELGRAMPGAHLQPHPVVPRNFRIDSWWSHPGTARLLVSEYVKFIPAALRLAMSRISHAAGMAKSPRVATRRDLPS